MNNIWSTPEYDSISRGFDYEEYKIRHKQMETVGAFVSPEAYKYLNKAFDIQLEEDIGT